MPGYEVIGEEEKKALNEIFDESNGVLYRYGFDKIRNNRYRVSEFEEEVKKVTHARFAHATSSGTSALIASLLALDVKPGDEVITQSHTFIATVEAILAVGATPVIANIDETLNMDPESFEELITENTKVVIPVHMSGCAADLTTIEAIARRNDIKILEDNAQSFGGVIGNNYLGTYGDVGILSFDPGKPITTGEGGMVLTNNEEIYKRVRAISDHGHKYLEGIPRGEDTARCLGYNFKMNELQGAVGLAQIKKLGNILHAQRENKRKILQGISSIPNIEFRKIINPEGDISDSVSFMLKDEKTADEFVKKWTEAGFGTKNLPDALNWHFAGLWFHLDMGLPLDNLEPSYNILKRTVSIPVNVKMDDKKITEIILKISEITKNL